ncbi:HD-GYP domain-containing protein [Anaeromusa acidaminophila]|uniref:HD-GYP domain-containing protein n=1 Tax=Anaeromusa acidaminophila TaxID=81464 RepID=UPI000363F209|nr:HD domain-containing phosphohydrolase [Anaeromusa acidaminophila]
MNQEAQGMSCSVQQLRPGMCLAGPAKNSKGAIVMQGGTVLDERAIALLQRLSLSAIDVVRTDKNTFVIGEMQETDELPASVNAEEAWKTIGAYCPLVSPVQTLFKQRYNVLSEEMKKIWAAIRLRSPVDWPILWRVSDEIADLCLVRAEVLPLLHFEKKEETLINNHLLSVAFLTAMIMRAQGNIGEKDIREAVFAALLHDVGKFHLPLRIMDKKGTLTFEEERIMRTHPLVAYRYLQETCKETPLPLPVLMGVLQHHERPDGQGYPMRVGSMKTHPYAKVLALADAYESRTSRRQPDGSEVSPFGAARELYKQVYGAEFEVMAGRALLKEIHFFLLGQKVELSNGKTGWVVQWDEECGENMLVSGEKGEFYRINDRSGIEVKKVIKT